MRGRGGRGAGVGRVREGENEGGEEDEVKWNGGRKINGEERRKGRINN